MYTDKNQVFSNTCGKIYKDRIVIATSHEESSYPLHEIKSLTFRQKPDAKGLLFACVPASLLALPFLFTREDATIKIVFGIVGVLGVALCLFKTQKKYSIRLETNSGRTVTISVWQGNKKEAEKFVGKALPLMDKAKNTPEAGYTMNASMAKAIS